jgi:hypothetical protein
MPRWHAFYNAWVTYIVSDLHQRPPEEYLVEVNVWFGLAIDVAPYSMRGEGMVTIMINLPDEVAAQIEAKHINQKQLDAFVVRAVKAWLNQRQVSKDVQHILNKRPWSEAFQDSAVTFVDQLIDENRALCEELARL